MIDTGYLVWGHAIGTAERRVDAPQRGRRAEPTSPPVRLDIEDLYRRFGSPQGEVRAIRYGENGVPLVAGHWKFGDVEMLYRDGRLELRGSLPKLLTGRNDVVLDERGVHDGLVKLAAVGEELARYPLPLREATPARMDYVYQWRVPSVAFAVEHLKAAYAPARKLRTEVISPKGGRSLVFGYGTKRVIRFYDKVGELLAHKIDTDEQLDTILRYEIQERRRSHLRLVHENGYSAHSVRFELEHALDGLAAMAYRDFESMVASYGTYPHAIAYSAATFHFTEHPEDLAVVRRLFSQSTYKRWKRRARRGALAVGEWTPEIPVDAFAAASSLWEQRAA